MSDSKHTGQIDTEELLKWIERQPELAEIRQQAELAKAKYIPIQTEQALRIVIDTNRNLKSNRSQWFSKFREIIWVPHHKLRGKAYATEQLDQSLGSAAKLMSLTTLWDFFTTLPIFWFGLKGSLGVLAGPSTAGLAFLLLWVSNVAGENAMNRSKGNAGKATISLVAFVVLSLAKTAFSGVGIDLLIGSQAIASRYAERLATEKLVQDKATIKTLEQGGPELKAVAAECTRLKQEMGQVNRNANEKQFISLFVQANGLNAQVAQDQGLNAAQLIKRYGSATRISGYCRQESVLRELNVEKNKKLREQVDRNSQLIKSKPPLAFLREQEPDIFKEHFIDTGSGKVEWVNGTEAVGEATDQFYKALLAGQFGLLGFALFFLVVALILMAVSSVLIYQLSLSRGVKASFTSGLTKYRDARLEHYRASFNDKISKET